MGRNKKISLFDRIEDKNNSTLHLLFSVDISSDIRDIRYRQSFSIKLKEGSRGYVFWGDGTMTTVFPKVGDLSSVSHAYSTSKTPNYRIEVWADTPDALLELKWRGLFIKKVDFGCCSNLRRLYFDALPVDPKFDFPCLEEVVLEDPKGELLVVSGVPTLKKLRIHALSGSDIQVLDLREANSIEELDLCLRYLRKIWISTESQLRSIHSIFQIIDKKAVAMITRIVNRNNGTHHPDVIQYPVEISPNERIRRRPYPYVGTYGNHKDSNDGLYYLLIGLLINAAFEWECGFGNEINISVIERTIKVQDNGRGFPLSEFKRLIEIAPNHNGINKTRNCGFGTKIVNALSSEMTIESVRDGISRRIITSRGNIVSDNQHTAADMPTGTTITYVADTEIFGEYGYDDNIIRDIVKRISATYAGLNIVLNGEAICYKHGLADFVHEKCNKAHKDSILYCATDEYEFAIAPCDSDKDTLLLSVINDESNNGGGYHVEMLGKAFKDSIFEYCNAKGIPLSGINSIAIAISISIDLPSFDRASNTRKLIGRDGYEQTVFGKTFKDELYGCFAKIIRRKLSKILDNKPDMIHAYILQDHKSI